MARVRVDATPEQVGQIRVEEIQQQIEAAGAFQVAAVAVEVERTSRGRLAGQERDLLDGLTPRKALELFLRSKNTPEDRIAALLEAAEELFAQQG